MFAGFVGSARSASERSTSTSAAHGTAARAAARSATARSRRQADQRDRAEHEQADDAGLGVAPVDEVVAARRLGIREREHAHDHEAGGEEHEEERRGSRRRRALRTASPEREPAQRDRGAEAGEAERRGEGVEQHAGERRQGRAGVLERAERRDGLVGVGGIGRGEGRGERLRGRDGDGDAAGAGRERAHVLAQGPGACDRHEEEGDGGRQEPRVGRVERPDEEAGRRPAPRERGCSAPPPPRSARGRGRAAAAGSRST